MKIKHIRLAVLAGFLGLALGNFAVPAANAGDSKAFFERRIAPILSESCAGCHNGDKLRGGLDLKALVLHSCRRGCVVNPDNDHPCGDRP